MPHLRISYVSYTHRHRRLHGSATTNIQTINLGSVPPPNPVPLPPFPASFGGSEFAFASIHGNTDSQKIFLDPAPVPANQVTVGTEDINVIVLYGPVGGPGTGNFNGVWIDAFNETSGAFIDDDFVTLNPVVAPNSNDHANAEGEVYSTPGASVTVTAQASIIRAGLPTLTFDKWVLVSGDGVVISNTVCVLAQANPAHFALAIAMYVEGETTHIIVDRTLYAIFQIILSGLACGPLIILDLHGVHPVPGDPGPGPLPFQINKKLAAKLSKDQKQMLDKDMNQLTAMYQDLYKSISNTASVAKQIGELSGQFKKG